MMLALKFPDDLELLMKLNLLISAIFCGLVAVSVSVQAAVSPYLPLKQNSAFELEVERLVTITGYPALKKPYHIASLVSYLDKVKHSHPKLYQRINRYIERYKTTAGVTHFQSQLRLSDSNEKTLHNTRGVTSNSAFDLQASAFWQPSEYFIANVSGGYSEDDGFTPHGSFLSFGGSLMQVDLGYREHWLSPLQGSSQLVSTHAKPMLGVTLSNVQPLSDWNIMYELAFGRLDTVDDIYFNDMPSTGKPGYLAMHASIQLTDWWTVSGSRTMQFGGGARGKVGLSEVWQAIIDPVSSDNCGSLSDLQDCQQEFGNQQAALASRMDLNVLDTPFSLLIEVAGEDTNDYKAYKLGNKAYSLGLFIPYLSPDESLGVTAQYIEDAWYSHHIYRQGLRNDGHVIGHWWGDEKRVNDGIGAKIISVDYSKEFEDNSQLRLEYHTIENTYSESTAVVNYKRGHYFKADYQWVYRGQFLGLHWYGGKDVNGESFNSISFSKQW